jgi:hypothetical protein
MDRLCKPNPAAFVLSSVTCCDYCVCVCVCVYYNPAYVKHVGDGVFTTIQTALSMCNSNVKIRSMLCSYSYRLRRPGHEGEGSSAPSAQIKNNRSCTSSKACLVMV